MISHHISWHTATYCSASQRIVLPRDTLCYLTAYWDMSRYIMISLNTLSELTINHDISQYITTSRISQYLTTHRNSEDHVDASHKKRDRIATEQGVDTCCAVLCRDRRCHVVTHSNNRCHVVIHHDIKHCVVMLQNGMSCHDRMPYKVHHVATYHNTQCSRYAMSR